MIIFKHFLLYFNQFSLFRRQTVAFFISYSYLNSKKDFTATCETLGMYSFMAEGVGFEPTERANVHSISSRAPSTGLSHPSTYFIYYFLAAERIVLIYRYTLFL